VEIMGAYRADAILELARLECRVRVVAPASALNHLAALLPDPPAWLARPRTDTCTDILLAIDTPAPGLQQLLIDATAAWRAPDHEDAAPALEWAIVRGATRALSARYLPFHAGAVVCGGHGLLLPAASGSGKTTLVAALVAAGCAYCCDDLAVVDAGTFDLYPFVKSLCVKSGSWEVLYSLYPALRACSGYARFGQAVRYLRPPSDAWATAPAPVRSIVFPRYVPGAATCLQAMRRADALPLLLQALETPPAEILRLVPRVTALLRRVECHMLTIGDLQEAVRCVQRLGA
jgi:hypothetical protein